MYLESRQMARLAYILFGQVKNYNDVQHEQYVNYIQPGLEKFEVDHFLITSQNETYDSPRNGEANERINHKSIEKFYNFKTKYYDDISIHNKILTKEITGFADYLVNELKQYHWGRDSLPSTVNTLKQIYSLNYFYKKFKKIQAQYDYYILARSDIFYTNKIQLPELEPNNIYVPCNEHYGGVNDRWALITSSDILNYYCTRYDRLKNTPGQGLHSESYLHKVLLDNNIHFKRVPRFKFRLLRTGNRISREFLSSETDEGKTKLFYPNG